VTEAALPAERRRPRWAVWLFAGAMALLGLFFLGLGKWQLDRLAWKEGLMADVAANMHQPPATFPPIAEWQHLDLDRWQYRPVTVTGRYEAGETVRVFVGLTDAARGQYHGPGYWIMTPLTLEGGGTVWIDQGFVPQAEADRFADGGGVPTGTVTLSGVAVPSESADMFTPTPDAAHRIDWTRDLGRLSKSLPAAAQPVAPLYIDLPAGARGALPQGGETVVDFPNNHLGYAATWFGFALTTFIMLAEWLRRQFKRGRA
jgi:surfeit locus 1 family protein